MAATKTLRTLVSAGTTNAAGGTTTGTTWNLTTAYGGVITSKITNGGTGPTVACSFTVNISGDGNNWKKYATVTADVANSAVYEYAFELPAGVMYAQPVFTGNTGQAVTVESFGEELTTI